MEASNKDMTRDVVRRIERIESQGHKTSSDREMPEEEAQRDDPAGPGRWRDAFVRLRRPEDEPVIGRAAERQRYRF